MVTRQGKYSGSDLQVAGFDGGAWQKLWEMTQSVDDEHEKFDRQGA